MNIYIHWFHDVTGRVISSQAPKFTMQGVIFFYFYANIQRNMTWANIYYYITTEFKCTKGDSHLAAYRGFVLQRFQFIK